MDTPRVNPGKVVAIGIAAFAASGLWYGLFGGVLLAHRPDAQDVPLWTMLVAPLREIAVAYVLARLIPALRLAGAPSAALLGFGLWLAFHAVMMTGAVLFERMPVPVAVVHAGDWLMKMLLMSVLTQIWHRRKP
jgi:hypothetical protein